MHFKLTLWAASLFVGFSLFIPHVHASQYDRERAYCREYTKTVRIHGRTQSAFGRACLQPDGDWKIVSYRGDERLYDDLKWDIHEPYYHVPKSKRKTLANRKRHYRRVAKHHKHHRHVHRAAHRLERYYDDHHDCRD